MKKDIFISYSSLDSEFVEKLAADLKSQDIKVWLDKWDIELGANVTEDISNGLEESRFLLVVITKNSLKSKWVKEEWTNKYNDEIESGKIMVIPMIAGEIKDEELPGLLRGKNRLNLEVGYEAEVHRLSKHIIKKRAEEVQQDALPFLKELVLEQIKSGGLQRENPLINTIRLLLSKAERASKYSTDRKITLIFRDIEFVLIQLEKDKEVNQKLLYEPSDELDFLIGLLDNPNYIKEVTKLIDKMKYIKNASSNDEHCLEDLLFELESWLLVHDIESN